jgi:hypothetical protein
MRRKDYVSIRGAQGNARPVVTCSGSGGFSFDEIDTFSFSSIVLVHCDVYAEGVSEITSTVSMSHMDFITVLTQGVTIRSFINMSLVHSLFQGQNSDHQSELNVARVGHQFMQLHQQHCCMVCLAQFFPSLELTYWNFFNATSGTSQRMTMAQ